MGVVQTGEELKSRLKEQIQLLTESAKRFDEEFYIEAINLAVRIRVLVHDTTRAKSLLTLLNRKENMQFYDTAKDYNPRNLGSTLGLVGIMVGPKGGYYAPLDNLPPSRNPNRKVPFEEWWNKIVFVDLEGNKLTRKDIVLGVAHKDGGAHIDSELDESYAGITRGGSLACRFFIDGEEKESSIRPELASIRQITHEVLKSLRDEFSEFFDI